MTVNDEVCSSTLYLRLLAWLLGIMEKRHRCCVTFDWVRVLPKGQKDRLCVYSTFSIQHPSHFSITTGNFQKMPKSSSPTSAMSDSPSIVRLFLQLLLLSHFAHSIHVLLSPPPLNRLDFGPLASAEDTKTQRERDCVCAGAGGHAHTRIHGVVVGHKRELGVKPLKESS